MFTRLNVIDVMVHARINAEYPSNFDVIGTAEMKFRTTSHAFVWSRSDWVHAKMIDIRSTVERIVVHTTASKGFKNADTPDGEYRIRE